MQQRVTLENFHTFRLPLPTHPDLGTANVYLLGSHPVTLIDAAPKIPGSFEFIKDQLRQAGHDTPDIERILITHGHVDHFGLVTRIREDAGRSIPCFIHAEDRWRVGADRYRALSREEADHLMNMVDVPAKEYEKIEQMFSFLDEICDPVTDAIAMEDGDIFEGEGYRIRVVHTPGHTPGNCCFYETRNRILFSGDHILKNIHPKPLFELNKELIRDPGYLSLRAYQQSLDKVSTLDLSYVFPGHGERVEDLPGLVAAYRKHHRERMDRIWRTIRDEPRPLYHIIDQVFDVVPDGDVFLAISEILVHLEILAEEGRVELTDPGPPAIYHAL